MERSKVVEACQIERDLMVSRQRLWSVDDGFLEVTSALLRQASSWRDICPHASSPASSAAQYTRWGEVASESNGGR